MLRNASIIFLLVAYVLASGVGHCEIVWHGSDSSIAPADVVRFVDERDHHHHDGCFALLAMNHDHDDSVPDHSHVYEPDTVSSAPRSQAPHQDALAPAPRFEITSLLPPLRSIAIAKPTDDRVARGYLVPLVGRTSNLLF